MSEMRVVLIHAMLCMIAALTLITPIRASDVNGYKECLLEGHVSADGGPLMIEYVIHPFTVNIFEFNVSSGDEIRVRIRDWDNRSLLIVGFDERDYLIVNDSTKGELGGMSIDGSYWLNLPGLIYTHDREDERLLYIQIDGEGNYTMIVHWRGLDEWEKGDVRTYDTVDYEISYVFVLLIVSVFLIIVLVVATLLIIYMKRPNRPHENAYLKLLISQNNSG